MADEFSLRPILIPAFGPALLFGVAEGAVLPVVALTARDLGGSLALASLIVALIGIGSLVSNIPSALITTRHGERTAIITAGAVSCCSLLLAMLVYVLQLGVIAVAGVAVVAVLLAYEHSLVKPHDLSKLNAAFFTMNGIISMIFLFFVTADFLLRR